MSTTIRPELSEKNQYWLDKHRYYELKHFCLKAWGGGLKNHTPCLIAAVLKKSPEGYFGKGVYPFGLGAVFERACRVGIFS